MLNRIINGGRQAVVALGLMGFLAASQASQIVDGPDGRQIQLNDNGSWEYVSDEVFVDLPNGSRVALSPDGRWRTVGLAPVIEEEQYRDLDVAVNITAGEIEEIREKVGSGKNTRTVSTMNFQLSLALADSAERVIALSALQPAHFKITDNKGRDYAVVSVESSQQSLTAGAKAQIQLSSDDAPSGFTRVNYFVVQIAPEALATASAIELQIPYENIVRNRINR